MSSDRPDAGDLGPAERYRVVYSGVVRDGIRDLIERATLIGKASEMKTALRALEEQSGSTRNTASRNATSSKRMRRPTP